MTSAVGKFIFIFFDKKQNCKNSRFHKQNAWKSLFVGEEAVESRDWLFSFKTAERQIGMLWEREKDRQKEREKEIHNQRRDKRKRQRETREDHHLVKAVEISETFWRKVFFSFSRRVAPESGGTWRKWNNREMSLWIVIDWNEQTIVVKVWRARW